MEQLDNLFIPVYQLQNKHFEVKDYQRGYKWTKKEITDLLKDINDHKEEDGKYCLQPVIVKTLQNGAIELIDGQQRITSIYLLLYYLEREKFYHLDYQTRASTRAFLENELPLLHKTILDEKDWHFFIQAHPHFNNVDVFHLFVVYTQIHQWFDENQIDTTNFLQKLQQNASVIWYDIEHTNTNKNFISSAEQVFLNLNAGKIPLTSSELIKALFILDTQNRYSKEVARLKATELATEWDQIETKLHDDLFWFFICDDKHYSNTDTRIDFIIDLVNNRNLKKHDNLYAYRIYEERFKNEEDLDWKAIKKTFNKLLEWFENKKAFHLVGFLIVSGLGKLSNLLELSKNKSKTDFSNELEKQIKKAFTKTKTKDNKEVEIYDLENLHFQDYKKECLDVLLLLNVMYYVKNNSSNKFPFNLFKNQKWSVEHINPQNPRDFKTVSQLLEWLNVNREYYKTNNQISDVIDEVLTFVNKIEPQKHLKDHRFTKEQADIIEELTALITNDLGLHTIANLALLDVNTNSKIGNKPFLEKREEILALDQKGEYINSKGEVKKVYIPICTKNVFAKIYTTNKESTVKSFFGKDDMDAYYSFIENQLETYYIKNNEHE